MLDLLHPSGGAARIFGLDSRRDSVAIRARLRNLPGDFGQASTPAVAKRRRCRRGCAGSPTAAGPEEFLALVREERERGRAVFSPRTSWTRSLAIARANRDAPALVAGEACGVRLATVREADGVEQGFGASPALGAAESRLHQGDLDIDPCRQVRAQVMVLEDEADHLPVIAVLGPDLDRRPVDLDAARGRPLEAAP